MFLLSSFGKIEVGNDEIWWVDERNWFLKNLMFLKMYMIRSNELDHLVMIPKYSRHLTCDHSPSPSKKISVIQRLIVSYLIHSPTQLSKRKSIERGCSGLPVRVFYFSILLKYQKLFIWNCYNTLGLLMLQFPIAGELFNFCRMKSEMVLEIY